MRWRITVEQWPHSTRKGAEVDQAAAGDRTVYHYVDAEDIRAAMKLAECFAAGIKRNPHVWEAPIMGVHVYKEGACG